MMSYIMIELVIVIVALILFAISFCGFLQKWKLYVQEIEAEQTQHDKEEPPPYISTVQVDLPPKYDQAIKMPQLSEDVLLNVQKLGYKIQEDRVEIV